MHEMRYETCKMGVEACEIGGARDPYEEGVARVSETDGAKCR